MVRTLSKCGKPNINSTTEEDREVAKVVLSNMLVGYTNNIKEFFGRLELYWHIPKNIRQKAQNGAMKEHVNVQRRKSSEPDLSNEASVILRRSLSHDIHLHHFAKDVIWKKQSFLFIDE